MRHWRSGALLALLAVGTLAVVVLALRPSEAPPPSSQTPPLSGTVAVSGSDVWRWVGPSSCVPDADPVPVERLTDAGWVGADTPLSTVSRLSFADGRRGIAVGTTPTCGLGVALTVDGGSTWTSDPANPPLLDAWFVDRTVWGITRVGGPARLARYDVREGRLTEAAATTDVCDAVDGTPALTAFLDEERGMLLCEQTAIIDRLLARTIDGGGGWERLTDGRALTGLDGAGPIADLDLVDAPAAVVWVLFPGGECAEGQLRRSTNGGASFDPLPCPADSAPADAALDTVLGVGFTTTDDGVLLGLAGTVPVLLATDDGGQSWSQP